MKSDEMVRSRHTTVYASLHKAFQPQLKDAP